MDPAKRNLLIGGASALLAGGIAADRFLFPACLPPASTTLGDDRILAQLRPLVGDMVPEADLVAFAQTYARAFPAYVNVCGNEGHLVTRFLLSTTYFDPDRDPADPVEVTRFYDPSDHACANPLARFD